MSQENEYVAYRKEEADKLSKLFFILHTKYPIDKNKIVFSTFEGDGGFCCNPRYIAEEIHRSNPDYDMVWLTHNKNAVFPDYIRVVDDTQENAAYELATAKVWVDNYRKPFGTIKRPGQYYIQTWHASIGFKAVGLYRGSKFPEIARLVSEWDSNLADYFLSNSDYCDRVYPKKLLYNGPTLRTGSPRVDCLINNREELKRIIKQRYNLADNTKILLFAPTFRGGNQSGKKQVVADIPQIDFKRVIMALQKKFGGNWKIFLRLHPQLAAKLNSMPMDDKSDDFIDVSQAPDISEIMAASDMIITDYSSCAFDAGFANIPVLLYADDVQEYIANRGQFMWNREELPFDIAETNEQLEYNIMKFDDEIYKKRIGTFMQKNGVVEDGHAANKAANYIISLMK